MSGNAGATPPVDALFQQGLAAYQSGAPDRAGPLFRQVLAANPGHFGATQLLGIVHLTLGQPQEAAALLIRASQILPDAPGPHINLAAALLRLNQPAEALAAAERGIARGPGLPNGHYHRGVALMVLNRLQEAIASLDAALAMNPAFAEAFTQKGIALAGLNRLAEALAAFDRAIALSPGARDAHRQRGLILAAQGQDQEAMASFQAAAEGAADHWVESGAMALGRRLAGAAEACFARAAALDPHSLDAAMGMGMAREQSNRPQDAAEAYRRAVALNPDHPDALNHLGRTLAIGGRMDDAVEAFRHATRVRPDFPMAWRNLGAALCALKRFAEAEPCCAEAVRQNPGDAEAQCNLGSALSALERHREAIASLDAAIAARPAYRDAHFLRGTALAALHRYEEAIDSYRIADRLEPGRVETVSNLGNALLNLGRWDEAEAALAQAVGIDPDAASPALNLSLVLLTKGRYAEGWPLFEARKRIEQPFGAFAAPAGRPAWTGDQDLGGKTLFIYNEQGFGDTINFCRYASLAADAGARVVMAVQAPLLGLVTGMDPRVTVIDAAAAAPPEYDYHCAMMSLPLAFGTTLETIPAPLRYLRPSEASKAKWAARIPNDGKLRAGLVWAGNPGQGTDVRRSIGLRHCLGLLDADAAFFSLQKDLRPEDAGLLAAGGTGIWFLGGELRDFDDTAGLIDRMDVVIASDTSVPHLAAAMGKPVWLMLSHAADWRFLTDREDCPWYPSMRLFRQRTPGDWAGVIGRVRAALGELLAGR